MRPLLFLLSAAAATAGCSRDAGKKDESAVVTPITACPDGAILDGQAPPVGFRQRCQKNELERHGGWREWYENGRERAYSEWWKGEKHGRFALWFPNGKLRSEGAHSFNRPAGQWTYYGENGAILQQKTYEVAPPAADWLAQAIAGKPPVRDAGLPPVGEASSEMTGAGTIASPLADGEPPPKAGAAGVAPAAP